MIWQRKIAPVPLLLIILSLLLFSVPVFAANLLPNTVDNRWHYGFESDALLADDLCWEENGGGATNNTLIDGNEVNVRGTRSCKFDNPTTAYTGRYVVSSTVTVTAGTGYYVGAWAYVSLVAGVISETQIQLGIRWYDASDVLLSSEPVSGDLTLSTFTVWNKLIFSTITAPATATQARFLISGKETGGNDNDIYIDDAEFIEAVVADNIPPCGVSNLTALMGSADGEVNLVWTAPGDDGTSGDITSGSLTIYAATYTLTDTAALNAVSQSPYTLYKIVKSTAYTTEWSEHSYTMTGLYPGTTYYFAVTVTDDASNTSVWNYNGSVNTKSTAPACDLAPDIVTVGAPTPANTKITVNWTEPADFDISTYTIVCSTSDVTYTPVENSSNVPAGYTSWVCTGLTNNVTYYFRIATFDWGDDAANGLYSTVFSSAYAYVSTYPYITPPVTPGSWAGAGLSSTTIKWTWDNVDEETGYRIKYATDTATILKELAVDTTWWSETGLSINTSYYRVIASSNSAGESDLSSAATSWTLANPPTASQFDGVFQSSVTLSWAVNNNPSWTNYGLSYSTKSDFSFNVSTPAVFASGLTANTTAVTGLDGDTTYYFRTWAYNGDEVMSGFDSTISTKTAVAPASGTIVINEVAPGSSPDWVELYNAGSSPISVDGWTMDDVDAATPVTINITTAIPAGAYLVIYIDADGTNDTDFSDGVGTYYSGTATTMSLAETEDEVALYNSATQDSTTIVDFMAYCSDGAYGGATDQTDAVDAGIWVSGDYVAFTDPGADYSLALNPNGTDTDQSSDWDLLTTPNPGAKNFDSTAPGAVTDLAAAIGSGDGEADLTWTAPGSDGYSENNTDGYYDVRFETFSVTSSTAVWWNNNLANIRTFTSALNLSQTENRTMTSLTAGTTYWFAVKAFDSSNNESAIDDNAIPPEAQAYAMAFKSPSDPVPPAAISDLTALTGNASGTVNLIWTAVGDDGMAGGPAEAYLVKYSPNQITSANFDSASTYSQNWDPINPGLVEGLSGNRVVSGLEPGRSYYFAIKAKDNGIPGDPIWGIWPESEYADNRNRASANAHSLLRIANTGFELEPELTGWSSNSTSIDRSDDYKKFGTYSCKFNDPTSAYSGRTLTSSRASVTEGSTYTVGGYFYVAETLGAIADTQILIHVSWWDNLDNFVSSTTSSQITLSAFGAWELQYMDAVAPRSLGVTNARFSIQVKEDVNNNNDVYADGVLAFVDSVPPAAVTDLSAVTGANPGEIILSWTAPGDDGTLLDNITGASYEVVFATVPVTSSTTDWWLKATAYDQVPEYWTVSAAGTTEQKTLHLRPGLIYYFAVKTVDASGNLSEIDENAVPPAVQASTVAAKGFVGSLVRINEVAPSESSDADWIEFYNSSSTVNIKSWKVYINNSLGKTFPDFTFQSKTYIVLHFNSELADEDDVSGDINGNGYRDFYADVGGIPSGASSPADIMLTLRDPFAAEPVIDAMCVADKEGSTYEWTGDLVGYPGKSEYAFKLSPATNGRLEYNTAVSAGQWFGVTATGKNDGAVEDYCVSWKFGIKGYSIARDGSSTDGTNPSRNEWAIAEVQTPGSANFVSAPIDIISPGQITDIFVTTGPYRGSLKITFSNVGDDGMAGGEVSSYDARYSEDPIVTEANFKAAIPITYASKENAKDRMRLEFGKESTTDIYWVPGSTGTKQEHILGEFTPGVRYYFAVKGEDEQGNKSPMSTGLQLSAFAADITGSPVVINEISPINAEGKDWIEFYNASASTMDLSGWKICLHYLKSSGQDYFKPIKIIPSAYYLAPGAYVVLNFGTSGTDETPPVDTNGNGYYDIYVAYAQFNDAESNVILIDGDDNVVDCVLYSDRAVSLNQKNWDDNYVECCWAHQWSPISEPANAYSALSFIANTNMVDWSQGAVGYTLARDENSTDSDDTGNARDDWRFSRPTKGLRNDSTPPSRVGDLAAVNLATVAGDPEEGNVLLSWTAPGDDGAIGDIIGGAFQIRYSSLTSAWNLMEYEYYASTSIAPGTVCSQKITGLYPGSVYFFLMKTEDEAGNMSSTSTPVTSVTITDVIPAAPTPADISWVRFSASTATIYWLAGPLDIDYYNVSRRVGGIGAFAALGSTTSLSWTSNDLSAGATYYYRVWAVDSAANTSSDYCEIVVYNYDIPVIVSPVPFPREICMVGNDMGFSFELSAAQSVDTLEVEYFRAGVSRATATLSLPHDFTANNEAASKSADVTIPANFVGSSNFYYQIKYEGSGRKFETENIQVSVSRSSYTEWDQGFTFSLPDGNDSDGAVSIYLGAADGATPSGLRITQTVIPSAASASYSFPKGTEAERVDTSVNGGNGGMPVICWDIDAKDASGYDMDVAFANPVSITLLYLERAGNVYLEDVTTNLGAVESRLKAYFLDERNHVWRYIGGTQDTSLNTLSFKFPHLSRFALFATKADGIKPVQRFLTARTPGGIDFDDATKVIIYDPRGREVVTLTKSPPPIVWYGADRETSSAVPASQMVESGAYIYESFGAGGVKATGVIIVVK